MKRGRLLWSMTPAIWPKLGLFTLVSGPPKNCGVFVAFRKSVRKMILKRSPILLYFITETSRLRMGGSRTDDSRVDQVWNVNGCRIVHTGVSLPRQFLVVLSASWVQVLNQRSKLRLLIRGLAPVEAALAGKFIGNPS